MAGILFYFENFDKDVFSSRNPIDLDAWRYAMKAAGLNTIHCINTSSMFSNEQLSAGGDMNLQFWDTFEDWYSAHENDNMAIIETQWSCPETAIPLSHLDHSSIDWYVFGASNGNPTGLPKQYVYIPQAGMGALHSVHIASIVLTRRYEELL